LEEAIARFLAFSPANPGLERQIAQADCSAGLHTGEIEFRGADIGGVAVHLGQRGSATAESGEVLVTSTVKELVAGSNIEFIDRREHELKGAPGSSKLFAVAN